MNTTLTLKDVFHLQQEDKRTLKQSIGHRLTELFYLDSLTTEQEKECEQLVITYKYVSVLISG